MGKIELIYRLQVYYIFLHTKVSLANISSHLCLVHLNICHFKIALFVYIYNIHFSSNYNGCLMAFACVCNRESTEWVLELLEMVNTDNLKRGVIPSIHELKIRVS